MANTGGATLAVFVPKDAAFDSPVNGGAALDRKQNAEVLRFSKHVASATDYGVPGAKAVFSGVLPRPAGTSGSFVGGYQANTGIKVVISWSAPGGLVAGSVKWGAAFQLDGATDLPDPTIDAYNTEVTGYTAVNATTAAGMVQTTLSLTKANIKGSLTTDATAGDHYRLRIRRAIEDATNDTLAAMAYVHSVELYDY